MTFHDHFSGHASTYARARPTYPDALFEFLAGQCAEHTLAWDCATGNGQAAVALADYFQQVVATDGSAAQIAQAEPRPNIDYRELVAGQPAGIAGQCDLVTVAQALHWFDREAFLASVDAVLKPGGLLAVWCYGIHTVDGDIDAIVERLYNGILGPYWPPQRRLVERGYRDIELPYVPVDCPPFSMTLSWTAEQLIGYLESWSALQRFYEAHGSNPVLLVRDELVAAWGEGVTRTVSWPLALRVTRKPAG